MKKLLLVEDDISLGQILEERLSEDYQISWARTAFEALRLVQEKRDYHLIILDVGLPDINGFELAKKIKPITHAPFLFLTAQSDAESRLKGYQMGAEEFIPKPFHLKELLIRIEHVIKNHPVIDETLIDGVKFSFTKFQIEFSPQQIVTLGSSDMKILELLINKSPKVLDRDEIMSSVWGADSEMSHRSIDNIIVKLRSILGHLGDRIKTVRGQGYQWL